MQVSSKFIIVDQHRLKKKVVPTKKKKLLLIIKLLIKKKPDIFHTMWIIRSSYKILGMGYWILKKQRVISLLKWL